MYILTCNTYLHRHSCTIQNTPDTNTPASLISLHITPVSGDVFIFSGGHTAHKLISLHTTLISLHTTPLSGGYVYFLVATLPTNLYHYIQHLYHYCMELGLLTCSYATFVLLSSLYCTFISTSFT